MPFGVVLHFPSLSPLQGLKQLCKLSVNLKYISYDVTANCSDIITLTCFMLVEWTLLLHTGIVFCSICFTTLFAFPLFTNSSLIFLQWHERENILSLRQSNNFYDVYDQTYFLMYIDDYNMDSFIVSHMHASQLYQHLVRYMQVITVITCTEWRLAAAGGGAGRPLYGSIPVSPILCAKLLWVVSKT